MSKADRPGRQDASIVPHSLEIETYHANKNQAHPFRRCAWLFRQWRQVTLEHALPCAIALVAATSAPQPAYSSGPVEPEQTHPYGVSLTLYKPPSWVQGTPCAQSPLLTHLTNLPVMLLSS